MTKQYFFILASCSLLFSSCANMFHKHAKAPAAAVFYPSAPDTPRIQYLTSISGSSAVNNRSRFGSFVNGAETEQKMAKPYCMSMRNGNLYICDPGIAGLEIIDMEHKRYETFNPPGAAQLRAPLNCFVDIKNCLYVADPGRHDVVLFDSMRNYIGKLSDTGIFKPTDVMVNGDEVWVTNPDNHRLNIYDKNTRELIRYFADDYGVGDDGFLYSPYNVFVTDDKVYVTDFGDFRIKEYSPDGKFISAVGSYGANLGQFVRPKGIACDKDQNLFVVDAGFENVQIFNSSSQLLMFFGGPYKGAGDMWLPAKVLIDYDDQKYFSKYVDPNYDLKYLIVVSNQFGPDKINFYGAVSPRH